LAIKEITKKLQTVKSNRIAVVAYEYPVETSPITVNCCLDLAEKGYQVDLITDELRRDKSFKIPNVRIISFRPRLLCHSYWHFLMKRRFGKIILKFDKWLFAHRLKRIINNYHSILCMEFWSLDSVARTGFGLSKVIYLILEGIACTRPYNIDYVKQLLSSCDFCIVPSKERGADIEKYFNLTLDFEYLPISMRSPTYEKIIEKKESDSEHKLQIIYSGYFAEWACLREFIDAYQQIPSFGEHRLYLHGHKVGTEKYYQEVMSRIEKRRHITVDLSFYDSDSYWKYLSKFDIGVALYKNYCNSTDWENLIFSSGKIPSYLWSGLAILTNISHPHTKKPPFLYIDSISSDTISAAIDDYLENIPVYRVAAFEHAKKYYNLHHYMENIVSRFDATRE